MQSDSGKVQTRMSYLERHPNLRRHPRNSTTPQPSGVSPNRSLFPSPKVVLAARLYDSIASAMGYIGEWLRNMKQKRDKLRQPNCIRSLDYRHADGAILQNICRRSMCLRKGIACILLNAQERCLDTSHFIHRKVDGNVSHQGLQNLKDSVSL